MNNNTIQILYTFKNMYMNIQCQVGTYFYANMDYVN